ncbi:hypothetical protein PROFUN_17130, partial [Planoprotostelium fungivorum]
TISRASASTSVFVMVDKVATSIKRICNRLLGFRFISNELIRWSIFPYQTATTTLDLQVESYAIMHLILCDNSHQDTTSSEMGLAEVEEITNVGYFLASDTDFTAFSLYYDVVSKWMKQVVGCSL